MIIVWDPAHHDAQIAEATADFLEQLSIQIRIAPLRTAILAAFEHAEIELNEESREMMRLAAADEKVWRYFLGATSRMQPSLSILMRAARVVVAGKPTDGWTLVNWNERPVPAH